ncbi:hypothetical protein BCR39DRAFT_521422 [Naematelia encephala]|uniref:B-related factor 1 n=1 Tax=Naematelia encephala TaxID=71784 RepID=A0A1Y2BE81_9TREE|nr:hypothetical protein BCR39DRAFT_521422 [Naematelia encephala]
MPPKLCPHCRAPSTGFETDYSTGDIVCTNCSGVVESGILVSEVGFAEGSGGRVHVQGTFVAHNATGFGGSKGKGGLTNLANVKAKGKERITWLANSMGIDSFIRNGAVRYFSLAVDNSFTRGRRTEYVVASCLYLMCRKEKREHMLIDFSERLRVNVFELGTTYLKLRNILHIKAEETAVDPAIYLVRFASRLEFGEQYTTVATDASRLVKRFQADWMTLGRRPAGVCGACLVIAARMSGFLRTPDEIAQVVKVSPTTVRRRLLEFANTTMATKTVAEWRSLKTDAEIMSAVREEDPPIVKHHKKMEAKRKEEERKRKREEMEENGEEHLTSDDEREINEEAAIVAAAQANQPVDDDTEVEDPDIQDIPVAEYAQALRNAADDPEAEQEEHKLALAANRRMRKEAVKGAGENAAATVAEITLMSADAVYKAFGDDPVHPHGDDLAEEDLDENIYVEKEGEDEDDDEDEERERRRKGKKRKAPPEVFTDWGNKEASFQYLKRRFFEHETAIFGDTASGQELIEARMKTWLGTRDPKSVIEEADFIQTGYRRAARWAGVREVVFPDLDEEELDAMYEVDEADYHVRARLFLDKNADYLQEQKEREERKAAVARSKGIDPNKPKIKRKSRKTHQGPSQTPREALQNLSGAKKFSSRINFDALKSLGFGTEHGLFKMADADDTKEEDVNGGDKADEDWEAPEGDNEKYDEGEYGEEDYEGEEAENWNE